MPKLRVKDCSRIILFGLLALLLFLTTTSFIAQTALAQAGNSSNTLVWTRDNTLDTLAVYNRQGTYPGEFGVNCYNSLFVFENQQLKPSIATKVPTRDNGLIRMTEEGGTYIEVPIREGVKFHNGELLTPQDVEYTFERYLVLDASPSNQIIKPLLGTPTIDSLIQKVGADEAFKMIKESVEVEGGSIVFKLPEPFAPFIYYFCQNGRTFPILNKNWLVKQGAWPGTEENWQSYSNPKVEEDVMYEKEMGTGPFKLKRWDKGKELILTRFEDYWEGPAKLEQLVRLYVTEWSTKRLMLKAGDVDIVPELPAQYLPQIETMEGISILSLPSAGVHSLDMTWSINPEGNRWIGSGKLDGNGIPTEFFSDIDVRKAFSYSFNWETAIEEIFLGYASQPKVRIPKGVKFFNPEQETYHYDPEKAEEHFKKAWSGELWEKGFKLSIIHAEGSLQRKRELEILAANIEDLNPKFEVNVESLQWNTLLSAWSTLKLPIANMGTGVLPDPYSLLYRTMHSDGWWAKNVLGPNYQDFAKKRYDQLIEEFAATYDTEKRKEICYEIQRREYEDAKSIYSISPEFLTALADGVMGYEEQWNTLWTYSIYGYGIWKE